MYLSQTSLSIHLLMDGYLDCFLRLAIINDTAVNMRSRYFFDIVISGMQFLKMILSYFSF